MAEHSHGKLLERVCNAISDNNLSVLKELYSLLQDKLRGFQKCNDIGSLVDKSLFRHKGAGHFIPTAMKQLKLIPLR